MYAMWLRRAGFITLPDRTASLPAKHPLAAAKATPHYYLPPLPHTTCLQHGRQPYHGSCSPAPLPTYYLPSCCCRSCLTYPCAMRLVGVLTRIFYCPLPCWGRTYIPGLPVGWDPYAIRAVPRACPYAVDTVRTPCTPYARWLVDDALPLWLYRVAFQLFFLQFCRRRAYRFPTPPPHCYRCRYHPITAVGLGLPTYLPPPLPPTLLPLFHFAARAPCHYPIPTTIPRPFHPVRAVVNPIGIYWLVLVRRAVPVPEPTFTFTLPPRPSFPCPANIV